MFGCDPGKPVLRRAAAGLVAYALALAADALRGTTLYFYYVAGVRPYRRSGGPIGLDPVARQAYEWFVRRVPERTLHNWQAAAARIVADQLVHWQ